MPKKLPDFEPEAFPDAWEMRGPDLKRLAVPDDDIQKKTAREKREEKQRRRRLWQSF